MRSILLRLASTSFLALAVLAPAQSSTPFTLAPVSIPVRAGDGSAVFTLTGNSGAGNATLTSGPVVDSATHAILSRAKVTIAPLVPDSTANAPTAAAPATGAQPPKAVPTPTSTLPISIPAGQTNSYQVNITGLSGTTVAEIELFAGNVSLGALPVIVVDAPLAVAIDGDGASADKPLDLPYDNPASIVLRNSDAQPYRVAWTFEIDGDTMASGTLDIPAAGSSRILLKDACDRRHPFFSHILHPFSRASAAGAALPPCKLYSPFVDRVHPAARKGVLLFSVLGPEDLRPGLLPARTLPINLLLHRVSPTWTTIDSYFYAGFLLFIGGLLSVVASSVLPTKQKIGDLRSQIQALANRTTGVSTRVDSYLRVLLRLERSRIKDTLDQAADSWIPSPDAIAQVTASIATLDKRLTAAERLDDLRRKHDLVAATAPPSLTDSIDTNLQAAADQLHSLALPDTDLTAANAFLAKAQASLDMLNDADALAKLISGNLAVLQARLDKFPPNYYADIKDALPGVFVILDRGYDNPKNIVRPMFFAIDHGIAAIQLALDYAMVRASIPGKPVPATPAPALPLPAPVAPDNAALPAQANVPAPAGTAAAKQSPPPDAPPLTLPISAAQCTDLGADTRKRLLERQCTLIDLLGTLSWRALRQATLLVQEMREDTYEEDILTEMTEPHQAEITFDSQRTRPYLPVFFTITFKDSRFNCAAALQLLICHWDFPDGLKEISWNVCHYFTGYEPPSAEPCPSTQTTVSATPPAAVPTPAAETQPHRLRRIWPFSLFRHPTPPPVNLLVYATVRGQKVQESTELPIPPLKQCIKLQSPLPPEHSRFWADTLRFAIAFGIALAGLVTGALDQLGKLDFIPATFAIVALGFGANSVKNLLTDSASPQTPAPPVAKKP